MTQDVLTQKITLLTESLRDLSAVLPASFALFTESPLVVPAAERYFQLVVDAAVELNTKILDERGIKTETYFATFEKMKDCGLIDADLAQRIAPSVGLRNAIVHRYETVQRQRMFDSMHAFLPLYQRYAAALVDLVVSKK
jgi:uncharacterized protein YutE (UPF0331/DUF86 family)